jgi:hypothetical protein
MISGSALDALKIFSKKLGVPADNLYRLINFESAWNPAAKNSRSGARGIIQFTNSTAKNLGYASADDLVKKNPSIVDQLSLVYNYLADFAPFPTVQSLYMSVFYPAARNWSPEKQFPDIVKKMNPNVNNPGDYVAFVDGKKQIDSTGFLVLILIASLVPLIIRSGR